MRSRARHGNESSGDHQENARGKLRDTRRRTQNPWFGLGDQDHPTKNRNLPMDEARIFCVLNGSPECKVLSNGSSGEVEVMLVPRGERPDDTSVEVLVAYGSGGLFLC